MVRTALVLTCVVVVVPTATGAGGAVVRADGRVGPFRIDVTTEAQLRAVAGKPERVFNQFSPPRKSPVGHTLHYRCGPTCYTNYSINNSTGRLSDFESNSTGFVTERGSHVGTRGVDAARREQKKLVPGCGDGLYLHLRWNVGHIFVLTVWHGKVDYFIYQGPHSVYYDGLC